MASLQQIEQFVAQRHIAVAGISRTPQKFGNAIFKELQKKGYTMYPVHPQISQFEGIDCYRDIASLPAEVSALVINTKPEHTPVLLEEAMKKGIQHIWLQQGSAGPATREKVEREQLSAITGECILMFASPTHFIHKTHRFINKVVGKYPK